MPYSSQNIGNYLIQQLYDHGVRHVFGVPGDFVLGFYQEIILSNKLRLSIYMMNKERQLRLMLMLVSMG